MSDKLAQTQCENRNNSMTMTQSRSRQLNLLMSDRYQFESNHRIKILIQNQNQNEQIALVVDKSINICELINLIRKFFKMESRCSDWICTDQMGINKLPKNKHLCDCDVFEGSTLYYGYDLIN